MSYGGQDRRTSPSGNDQILSEIRNVASKVDDLNSTLVEHNTKIAILFGNGQPGLLKNYSDRIREIEDYNGRSQERDKQREKTDAETRAEFREIKEKVAAHETARQQEVGARGVWHMVTGFVGALIGWVLTYVIHGKGH